jgi:hypothetical protein
MIPTCPGEEAAVVAALREEVARQAGLIAQLRGEYARHEHRLRLHLATCPGTPPPPPVDVAAASADRAAAAALGPYLLVVDEAMQIPGDPTGVGCQLVTVEPDHYVEHVLEELRVWIYYLNLGDERAVVRRALTVYFHQLGLLGVRAWVDTLS